MKKKIYKTSKKTQKAGFSFSIPKISAPSMPGSRTLANLSRTADKYGDLHFISFYSSILARLAYTNDNNFLPFYKSIFGPIIPLEVMQGIDSVNVNNISQILNDETIFKLDGENKSKLKTYTYNGKQFVDFIGAGMPQNVNVAIGEVSQGRTPPNTPKPDSSQQPVNGMVKYISIGWSNYGEVYVLADKRMPNTICVIFRGTYSAKTAALYSKPTSAIPLQVCIDSDGKPESYLYGIFKASVEMIHTIIESMRYLATDFLKATNPESIKVFTTGHSLGAAMSTNFAYLWLNSITKTAPYNAAPYNVFSKKIICISLGSPRCFNTNISEKFCNYVQNEDMVFLRITSRGDPVPSLPPSITYFSHPCSDSKSLANSMREKISEDCNANLIMQPFPNVDYTRNLDCQNYKTRIYAPNMLSHMVYLDIMYTNALDPAKFAKGIATQQEVQRSATGSTIARLIIGDDDNYNIIFFDVNAARDKPTNIDAVEAKAYNALADIPNNTIKTKGGYIGEGKGHVAEDLRVDKNTFDIIIQKSIPIAGTNKCPITNTGYQIFNEFAKTIMPDLQCAPSSKTGGRKRRHTRRYHIKRCSRTRKHFRRK